MGRTAVVLVVVLSTCTAAHAVALHTSPEVVPQPVPVVPGPGVMLHSASAGLAARETAGPDTFALYGGPDQPTEGKFQLANGVTADWGGGNGLPGGYGGGPDAWTPVDLTYERVFWQVSTFNAENLNDHGAGNHAMWCGLAADDPLTNGWFDAPGYGHSWHEQLVYESAPLADPSSGQTVVLDFYFNHDFWDAGWDFLDVEYDSAGTWVNVASVTGVSRDSNNVFAAPGVRFVDVQEQPILYTGDDYGGATGDRIRIRLLVRSDGGWDDQDGGAPTVAGATQVDDIALSTSQGLFFEDFEGAAPYLFTPVPEDFAGDFAEVYPRMSDVDPCRENETPVVAFVDLGQNVRNGPGMNWQSSTGGSTAPGIDYGFDGNPVVNYTDGISASGEPLTNEIWSPEILWDLPGPDDDDVDVAGARMEFDVWVDLPIANGIFYYWSVRSAPPGQPWGWWTNRNLLYHNGSAGLGAAAWYRHAEDLTDLVGSQPERIQVALRAWDHAALFGFPGNTATPSPVFDDVVVKKYRLGGPALSASAVDLANDGFPPNGSIDASTPGARGALDVRFDMARDVNSSDYAYSAGDSVVVDCASRIPGATLTDLRIVWALATNPVFEDALRSAPSRPEDESVVAGAAGTVWTGEVVAGVCTTRAGSPVEGRFFADLPDVDLLYPGDVLHYYWQATDSDGRTTTLPADTTDFMDFGATTRFDRAWTVRALPTLLDTAGSQPQLLVYNDFGRRGGENEWVNSLAQLGFAEGVDYDSYTVQGPTLRASNGLGSAGAHGATASQLTGYHHILYFLGDLGSSPPSNGDSQSAYNDKSDDLGVLEQWHALAGTRNVAYFGDDLASSLEVASPEGAAYLANTMGVSVAGPDVRPAIGGQITPAVVPNPAGTWAATFVTEVIANGGCPRLRTFDQIQPGVGAEAGHYFSASGGVPITDPAAGVASVVNSTASGLEITFPFGHDCVLGTTARQATALPARTLLLGEVLTLFAAAPIIGDPTPTPEFRRVELRATPNPFNPSTTIEFTAPPGARVVLEIFNLRGERVKQLFAGELRTTRFDWDGTDDRGASVASGIYVVKASSPGVSATRKVALVK